MVKHNWYSDRWGLRMVSAGMVVAALAFAAPLTAHGQAEGLADNLNRYSFITMNPGTTYYADRTFTIISLPAFLEGAAGIQTANDDKGQTTEEWITFDAVSNIDVYVAYDNRAIALPNWLDTFVDTGLGMAVSDGSASPLRLLKRTYAAGSEVVLGGNIAPGAINVDSHYSVLITETPEFSVQPQGLAVVYGNSVSFSAELSLPVEPVSYQWQLDQVDIPDAEDPTYEIASVTFADQGAYRAIITDASKGVFISDEAILTVSGGPGAPAAGTAGLALLVSGLVLGGALLAARRQR